MCVNLYIRIYNFTWLQRDFDWTLYDDDEYVQLSNDVCLDDDEITMNVSKSSANRSSSSSVRTPWDIADKRMLVAEAKKHGIRPTARKHNMSFSTLRVWMMQDFGDLPGTKKRLSGGGRRLRYIHTYCKMFHIGLCSFHLCSTFSGTYLLF